MEQLLLLRSTRIGETVAAEFLGLTWVELFRPLSGILSVIEAVTEAEGVEGPPSPLHLAPTSPNPSEPDQTPRTRHPGHVKSASISAGSGGSSVAAREAPASAGAAEGRGGDSSRWRCL